MSFMKVETPGVELVPLTTNPEWTITYHRLYDVSPEQAEKVEVKGGRGITIWHLCFHEDLLQVINASRTQLLDVGWYPDSDPSGTYRLQLIRVHEEGKQGRDSYDWQNPVVDFKSRSLNELLQKIQEILAA